MEKEEYIYTWRNKWITAGAGSIDDFILTFEKLAESAGAYSKGLRLGIVLLKSIFFF